MQRLQEQIRRLKFGECREYLFYFLFIAIVTFGSHALENIGELDRWAWRPLPTFLFTEWGLTFSLTSVCLLILIKSGKLSGTLKQLDKYSPTILVFFIICSLIWFGFLIFNNPFHSHFMAGSDAVAEAQLYHNISKGFLKQTVFYDLNYWSEDGHVPIFCRQVKHWIAYLLYTPFYKLYPFPPMHIYAKVFYLITLGSIALYYAARTFGASKLLSCILSCGVFLIPHFEKVVFSYHTVETPSFFILVMLFTALYEKRFSLTILFGTLLSLVSIPGIIFTVIIAISLLTIEKDKKFGFFLLGAATGVYGINSLLEYTYNIGNEEAVKSGLIAFSFAGIKEQFFLRMGKAALIPQTLYAGSLICVMGLAPLGTFFLKRDKNFIRLVSILTFSVFIMNILRGDYPWGHYRNHNLLVLTYFLGVVFFARRLELVHSFKNSLIKQIVHYSPIFLVTGILAATLYSTKGYPWSRLVDIQKKEAHKNEYYVSYPIKKAKETDEIYKSLKNTFRMIPKDSYLGIDLRGEYQAWGANHLHVWRLNRQLPFSIEKLDYFLISKIYSNKYKHKYFQNSNIIYQDSELILYKNPQIISKNSSSH